MVLDIEISDVLSITQTIGIIGTLLLALYFSRRLEEFSTNILDLDDMIRQA